MAAPNTADTALPYIDDERVHRKEIARWMTRIFNQTPTGKFFTNQGGRMNYLTDRLFLGDAAFNDGTTTATQANEWLTTYQLAKGRSNGFIEFAELAALNTLDPSNVNTFVAGAQTKFTNAGGGNAIAIIGVGVNNNASAAVNTFTEYLECYRESAAAGGAYGLEIDPVNYAGVVDIDPYSQAANQTIALQLAAGAALSSAGQFASTAAVNIRNNNSTFERGIIFGSTAISGANGSAGTGVAIAFGMGHGIYWYGAANTPTSRLECTGTTTAGGIRQAFEEARLTFYNASNVTLMSVTNTGAFTANGALSVNGATVVATTINSGSTITAGADLQDSAVWATYTPSITSGTGAFTTVSGTGRWNQIGKRVFFTAVATITTNGTAATSVIIPLPVNNKATLPQICCGRENAVSGKMLQGYINSNNVTVFNYDNTYPGANGASVVVSGVYEAA